MDSLARVSPDSSVSFSAEVSSVPETRTFANCLNYFYSTYYIAVPNDNDSTYYTTVPTENDSAYYSAVPTEDDFTFYGAVPSDNDFTYYRTVSTETDFTYYSAEWEWLHFFE